jgi:hypothetical protein
LGEMMDEFGGQFLSFTEERRSFCRASASLVPRDETAALALVDE